MNKETYQQAMEHVPFADDLVQSTLHKIEESNVPAKKKWRPRTKWLMGGGSVLAAAMCLVLVFTSVFGRYDAPEIKDSNAPMAGMDMQRTGGAALNGAASYQAESFYDTGALNMMAVPSASYHDWNTEEYTFFQENRLLSTQLNPLSTFAADVDTASYAKLRSAILKGNTVPEDSVRIEELLNYFTYDYQGPAAGEPFGVTTEIAPCPWNEDTQLLLIGLQAQEIDTMELPRQNLVFLIDVSGSMDDAQKLPLVKRAFSLLLEELHPEDTVSIVTYASSDRVVLDGVRAKDKLTIQEALDSLMAGGGTDGSKGIQTAYELAEKNFIQGGNNRVILATDGDLNIGITDTGALTRLIEEKKDSGVYLSVLGFGMGNYKDNKLEALADHGNGNYAYIDTIYEARKALVEEMGATFFTVAKDVKLQVEFNPAKIKGYRLIGYENRLMDAEDFANDQKDGGEVGSGHRVTVLYEIVPIDSAMEIDTVETKYQTPQNNDSTEYLTVSIRAKAPEGDTSTLYTYPVDESAVREVMGDNLRFASAVAETGMLLRNSPFKGTASYAAVLERLRGTASVQGDVYKEEFQYLVTQLMRREK